MKSIIFVLIFSSVGLATPFPHDVLLQCTVKMQRLGFEKKVADESCSISAGDMCSELESQIVQAQYPNCVGDLIYMGVKPVRYAMQFCNLAARRQSKCSPFNYEYDRKKFVACVQTYYGEDEIGNILNKCLEIVLLGNKGPNH